ncbi:hypothetical protein D3C87_2025370 [compost metagenome]
MLHLHFDARHDDIVVLARERITSRAFPIWGMIAPQRDPAAPSPLDRLIVERSSRLDLWRQALQTEELGDGGVISRFSTCSRQAV